MKKITIKEVAAEAGVSISTVSNALNDSPLVTPATRDKILQTAERLNYIPNMNGRLLKAGKSKMIGFFSASVGGFYFSTLIDSIYKQCDRHGYGLNIVAVKDKKVIMNHSLGGNLDGVIMFQSEVIGAEEVALLKNHQVKTVFLDRMIQERWIASVLFDSFQAGYELTRHAITLGHRRIYFIEGDESAYDSMERKRGFLAAMTEHGLPVGEDSILKGMFQEQFTYQMLTGKLQAGMCLPDAFIAGNDGSAIGCINALRDRGYQVPRDVSVAGFDDIEIAGYIQPPLTTVRNPVAGLGSEAVETLMQMIDEGTSGTVKQLQGTLITRDSLAECDSYQS